MKRLKQQASDASERLCEEARSVKEQVTEKTVALTEAAKNEAGKLIGAQKERAAEKIEAVGSAIHKTAGVLKAAKLGGLARYVDLAAQKTHDASEYLEDSELGQITEDVSNIIREHPVVIYGGVLLIGMAVGRFVKAGEKTEDE